MSRGGSIRDSGNQILCRHDIVPGNMMDSMKREVKKRNINRTALMEEANMKQTIEKKQLVYKCVIMLKYYDPDIERQEKGCSQREMKKK